MVKDAHPEPVKEAASTVLPVWLDAFRVLLTLDPKKDVENSTWDGLAIRIQIVKVRLTYQKICCATQYIADTRHHPNRIFTSPRTLPS
jgi:hypothetical protein